jgi:hypothetical protein
VAERRERAVHRIRIVTTTGFRADTYNEGPTMNREFISKTWVGHLRHGPNDQCTFFAVVSESRKRSQIRHSDCQNI